MIDVSELTVDPDLGATTFTRKRPTTTLSDYGIAASAYRNATIAGIVQPAATKDVQYLPEGTRLSDVQAFVTADPDIQPGNGTSSLPDILVDTDGIEYRVLHVQSFPLHGMTRALAQRLYPGAA